MKATAVALCCLPVFPASAAPPTVRPSTASGTATLERGYATSYAARYDGRRAASGEIYHPEELTAAHQTLPFNTLVRVRRLDRNRSVIVRINDRGPFGEGRIIDLSHAAAVALGMVGRGAAPVALEIIGMQ